MPKVFYVGNDAEVRNQIESSSAYSQLMTSEDVREALNVALGSRFDIFVVDRDLRSVTDVGLCRIIREFDPRATIVILSSSQADVRLVDIGCGDMFLHKPEEVERLSETVRNIGPDAVKKHRAGPAHH